MDDVAVAVLVLLWFGVSTCNTVHAWSSMSTDAANIKSCRDKGYWQMGQERIICKLDAAKKNNDD